MSRRTRLVSALAAAGLAMVPRAGAQTPGVLPPRLSEDELDFQGRASLFVGSGARALGMGGAFLARADDATAATWNPAGLSYLRLPEVSLVGLQNSFDGKESVGGQLRERDHLSATSPDFLALTYPMSFGDVSGAFQVSFQRVIPYNGERSIERALRTGPDRELSLESEGGFDVIALGTGLQVTRGLRVGATLNHWTNGYRQTTEREVARRGTSFVDFQFSGFNVNLGVIWSPFEWLNVGAVGKTPFTGDVFMRKSRTDLAVDLPDAPPDTPPDAVTSNSYAAGRVTRDLITVDMPGAVGGGVSVRPRSNVTISADYTRTFWSKGKINNFFTLPPGSPSGAGPVPQAPTDVFAQLPFPTLDPTRTQTDSAQFRVGMEYVLLFNRFQWPLRAGYFSDGQFFRAANGSAPRFNGASVGTGIIVGPVLLDVAYNFESGKYSDSAVDPNTGLVSLQDASRTFHRFFVSIIYRHGGKP
jgi:long-subunit fatty acid transport protein